MSVAERLHSGHDEVQTFQSVHRGGDHRRQLEPLLAQVPRSEQLPEIRIELEETYVKQPCHLVLYENQRLPRALNQLNLGRGYHFHSFTDKKKGVHDTRERGS